MPGYVTHYIFGREMYGKLAESAWKQNLHRNHAVYALGHQGPDIFFYYLPDYLLHGRNLGHIAHSKRTGQFFAALLESRGLFSNQKDIQIANAYLAGFLGHYVLDTTCHPFIYGRTHYEGQAKDYFARHAYLETEIDSALLQKKLHLPRRRFRIDRTVRLTLRQKLVVARMLRHAYRSTYEGLSVGLFTILTAIFSTRLGFWLLYDRSGQKKALVRLTEKKFLGYPLFSPLIANDALVFRTDPFNLQHKKWANPWKTELASEESFFDLYKKSARKYLAYEKDLAALLAEAPETENGRRLTAQFLRKYGNLSFLSGLDSSLPT